ncbi:MAG: hypothetical protein QM808_01780 [Steroidobacteraceae bacterium]
MLKNRLITLMALLSVFVTTAMAPARAADTNPLADYQHNVLACLNTVTKATCYIWIGNVWKEGDNGYMVMWDRGVQTELPTVGGNFRVEGREGSYTYKDGKICLTPKANPQKKYKAEAQGEIYSGAGCYELPVHKVGDQWTQKDAQGREVKFWLLQGR